ncbi:MAG: hypothetical protein M3308_05130 [Actinomycetota bacterium]|nr:hypothetical protein [Actinomycetota bacterium]
MNHVETRDATFRRSVYGSLYPLAEWIAFNWWFLTTSIRPSATDSRYWTWPNVRAQQWLRHHNMRGAGDGMAWPDFTLVPEGPVTCMRWFADDDTLFGPVQFVSAGTAFVKSEDVATGLAEFVDHVLERLAEEGLPKTRLAEDWAALGNLDDDEKEFCATAARLGVDPFSLSELLAREIIDVANGLPAELVTEFFDNADATNLGKAAEWTCRASEVATMASASARDLKSLYEVVSPHVESGKNAVDLPWEAGYAMARRVRHELDTSDTHPFDVSPWLALGEVRDDSGGIQGVAAVNNNRCGLVLGDPGLREESRLFAQARALGRALVRPGQRSFLLSAARSRDERVAGAFAAELLAPAKGIREVLDGLGKQDDMALEAAARSFGVSPLVVRRQYDNQLARTSL